tara:strand:+ start:7276 stop:8223 length:948 start_codon:yes stop_codon:yes gene_type:complete
MVEARELYKSFGETQAVVGVSFSVPIGQIVGFLGPNGAGKTSTLRMLAGYLEPTKGQAIIDGVAVNDDPLLARRKIGYLPENCPLYDEMMVIDFLHFVAELRMIPPSQQNERLRPICDRCGISSVLGKDIGQLSKGYRQRVGFAQAIVGDPDLLLLDEPTSGLDPNQILEIRALIKELGKEKTIILSTHLLYEVQASCDRVIIISDGKLMADDDLETLMSRGTASRVSLLFGPGDGEVDATRIREVLASVPEIRNVTSRPSEGDGTLGFSVDAGGDGDSRPALFQAVAQNGLPLLEMYREQVSLEETFRKLTQGT